MKHSGRPDTAAREARTWDVCRVWELSASYVVPRPVERQGKASLCGRPHHVGMLWAGRTI